MEEDPRPSWGQKCSPYCLLPQRVTCALMGFLAVLFAFTNRISMSYAITRLVIPVNRTEGNDTDSKFEEVCPKEEVEESKAASTGTYDWSEQLQGYILSSFYIGYLISQVPGGILADKIGYKWVLGLSVFISGLCTVISPITITVGGAYALIVVRIIMGLSQGPIFPAMTVMLSVWVPARERGTLGTLCYSGSTVGIIVSNAVSGVLLFSLAWPWTFYFFGSLSIIWFVVFVLVCYEHPATHPFISLKEREYLNSTIVTLKKEKPPIPWKPMLLSMVMLSVLISQLGHDWGYYVMITCLPKYMSDVLQFSIRSNGLYTALPYVAMWIATILSGLAADWIIRTGKMSMTNERKLATFVAAVGPGLFMVVASYAGCNKLLVVGLLILCMFTMGPYYAGQKLSAIDLSPCYSGTIMAIANGLGSVSGIISPSIVGAMTPNHSRQQ
ncbi:putative inorganic phosphate cotransporter isoform X2 [Scaptodrosophila lebanonensis]|uniref:Inorganic phosphate cotransporter isoform X2 n=1 Tax=Drosophila lebanonensis TaxID=7225 RepID=A0A6J2TQT0_DROLE|nr:putative inorganic phosphate cotransporter isoform X2 [Scaptodrosophila lebanonensis]